MFLMSQIYALVLCATDFNIFLPATRALIIYPSQCLMRLKRYHFFKIDMRAVKFNFKTFTVDFNPANHITLTNRKSNAR